MNRYSKLPARFLLVLLGTILIAAGMTSVSLAAREDTTFLGRYFDVVDATTKTADFDITRDCEDTDEHCTVKVTRNPAFSSSDFGGNTAERFWKNKIDDSNLAACEKTSNNDEDDRGREFEDCWKAIAADDGSNVTYTIVWPYIHLRDNDNYDFEITPYCKSGDDVCAEELIVCYNSRACYENEFDSDAAWRDVGELWDDAGSCLYNSDNDDVWECLQDALDDWLDEHMNSDRDDYEDLEDERDRVRGFVLNDYEDDLNDVHDQQSSGSASETVRERYQRQWNARTPVSIYQSVDDVDTHGPSFRLTADEYLTVNFTAFLESTSPYQVCNTTIGCVTVSTYSNTFRSYMQNLHIVIQDRSVMRCMDRAGWDVDDDHAIPFDNPDLIVCDERMKTANEVCPAKNTGASDDLFAMWDTGLLRGILADSFAQGLRLQVERARDRTPECLCAAGFAERNFVVTPENTEGPWERSGALRTEDVCD